MKAYVVLFTCAVVRAVHLELYNDMTVSAFLMSFGDLWHTGVF